VYIESPANDRVRAWARLKTRRGRLQQQAFLAEGRRLLAEVLSARLKVKAVLWDVGTDELPPDLSAELARREIPVFELSPQAFAAVADTVTPQGVIAIVERPQVNLEDIPAHALLLDGVQDPGNVGTLLRTAEAFGIRHVCCGQGTVDPYSPKVVRAAMGGVFRLDVSTLPASDFIDRWRRTWPSGQVLVASAGGSKDCHRVDYGQPTLMVIGNEAHGISQDVAERADVQVRIPMRGAAESLNAAIAGAILLYEMMRPSHSFDASPGAD
jgi:TrmH family RNA methyltransferase